MITDSLITTGAHVLCRYCGRPIRFFKVTVTTNDATGEAVSFLAPDYHPACHKKALQVVGEAQTANRDRKEIPYWVRASREYDRKQALMGKRR